MPWNSDDHPGTGTTREQILRSASCPKGSRRRRRPCSAPASTSPLQRGLPRIVLTHPAVAAHLNLCCVVRTEGSVHPATKGMNAIADGSGSQDAPIWAACRNGSTGWANACDCPTSADGITHLTATRPPLPCGANAAVAQGQSTPLVLIARPPGNRRDCTVQIRGKLRAGGPCRSRAKPGTPGRCRGQTDGAFAANGGMVKGWSRPQTFRGPRKRWR